MLDKIDTCILIDLYEFEFNGGEKINQSNYELQEVDPRLKKQELAWHLSRLERFGYIEYQGQAFITGGQLNRKYNNNVIMIWAEAIHIKEKGIEYVQEVKKTVLDKLKEEGKGIASKVYEELKDWGTKAIAEYFVSLTKSPKSQ
jgi:hypothetical protein